MIVAPQPFTAHEMAAYVLAHEVRAHLIEGMGATSNDEMVGNYYGLQAVQKLRSLAKQEI